MPLHPRLLAALAVAGPTTWREVVDAGVDGDAAPSVAVLSKDEVEEFFYDDLCCNKLGESCVLSGTPRCCPEFECVVPDGGTEGTCEDTSCSGFGEDCYFNPCCEGMICDEDWTCRFPLG